MKYNTLFLFLLLGSSFLFTNCNTQKTMIDNSTVPELDLQRYLGTWYEIARFPHSFEKNLAGVTATYSLKENGKIRVLNQGYKNNLEGKLKKAVGKAYVPSPENPAQLKVSFFLFFYGDYFVMELDQENYQWAVVGSKSPGFLWILCRTPQMDESLYQDLLDRLVKRGYDLARLEKVEQPRA